MFQGRVATVAELREVFKDKPGELCAILHAEGVNAVGWDNFADTDTYQFPAEQAIHALVDYYAALEEQQLEAIREIGQMRLEQAIDGAVEDVAKQQGAVVFETSGRAKAVHRHEGTHGVSY